MLQWIPPRNRQRRGITHHPISRRLLQTRAQTVLVKVGSQAQALQVAAETAEEASQTIQCPGVDIKVDIRGKENLGMLNERQFIVSYLATYIAL